MEILTNQSLTVIYASVTGAKLDSDVRLGGGTNDTAILQEVLDSAISMKSLHLIMDGAALVSGLRVHSNTTIECLNSSCGFFLADDSNCPIIRNADLSINERKNNHISLLNGTYNGNCQKQVHHTADNSWVVGLAFFGVSELTVKGITILDSRTFGLHLANWYRVNLENIIIEIEHFMLGQNQDGIHVNGPGRFLTARNIQGFGEDDFFALNADDGEDAMSKTNELGPWVREGDITDVLIDGLILNDSIQGVRLLSRVSRLDRVVIRNVIGTNRDFGFLIEPYRGNAGNFGSIVIENVDIRQHDALKPQYGQFLVLVRGEIENLSLRNFHRHNSADNRPLIFFGDNANVRCFSLDGLSVYESNSQSANTTQILIQGNIELMNCNNIQIFREPELLASGVFILIDGKNESCGVNYLNLNTVNAFGLKHILQYTKGYLKHLYCVNIQHMQTTTVAFTIETGEVETMLLANYSGECNIVVAGKDKIKNFV